MIVAFVESIKYVGHLLPIAFLRIFIGYYYVNQALLNARGGFLSQPYLAEDIRNYIPQNTAPDWYKMFLESIVVPNWQIFAYVIVGAQIAIGVSYVIGYLVRPMSLLGLFLATNIMLALGGQQFELQSTFMLILHFTLGWLGAGRCLGFDYFFYKRRRGIWW
jgi:thiosulfate dehydrogenase [quinone] large subunit